MGVGAPGRVSERTCQHKITEAGTPRGRSHSRLQYNLIGRLIDHMSCAHLATQPKHTTEVRARSQGLQRPPTLGTRGTPPPPPPHPQAAHPLVASPPGTSIVNIPPCILLVLLFTLVLPSCSRPSPPLAQPATLPSPRTSGTAARGAPPPAGCPAGCEPGRPPGAPLGPAGCRPPRGGRPAPRICGRCDKGREQWVWGQEAVGVGAGDNG